MKQGLNKGLNREYRVGCCGDTRSLDYGSQEDY